MLLPYQSMLSDLMLTCGEVDERLQRPVIGTTGLARIRKYDLMFSQVPEQRGRTTPDGDSVPTLQRAIRVSLGLRLKYKKSMVDVLVVDGAEDSPLGIKPEVARCAPCMIRVIEQSLRQVKARVVVTPG